MAHEAGHFSELSLAKAVVLLNTRLRLIKFEKLSLGTVNEDACPSSRNSQIVVAAKLAARVKRRSASLGVASPLGWLCTRTKAYAE